MADNRSIPVVNQLWRTVMSRAAVGLRLALGIVLLWSGISKIMHPYEFLDAVYGYRIVGPTAGILIATALPWTEFCAGILLLSAQFLRGALLASVILGIVFVIAQKSALGNGLSINCGCFGSPAGQTTVSHATILRAAAVAVTGFVLTIHEFWKSRGELVGGGNPL